jgi:hypothetical protein
MALVMNVSEKDQHVTVFGNHFVLKKGSMKMFQDNIAHFLITDRKDMGFVGLPDEFLDPAYKETAEGKALVEMRRKEGVANRINKLNEIAYNLLVSLKQDLDRANIKADPRTFASEGEIAALEELAMYKQMQDDEASKRTDRIKQLEATIGKVGK